MKVLLVNGSPHKHGCTDTALTEVSASLNREVSKQMLIMNYLPSKSGWKTAKN